MDEPVRSMTRNPVRSMIGAMGSAMPQRISMPHRLCWPSRMVVSRNSMCAMMCILLSFGERRQAGPFQPSRRDGVVPEIRVPHHESLQCQVGTQAADFEGVQSAFQPADGIFAVGTASDQLADHAVVVRGDPLACTAVRVEAYAVAARRVPASDVAGRRPEVTVGVLGVDPALDGMPPRFDIRLRQLERLSESDLELQGHEIGIRDKLRDRDVPPEFAR